MIKIIILTILGVILAIISFIDSSIPAELRIKTALLSGMFFGPLIDLLSKKLTDRFN